METVAQDIAASVADMIRCDEELIGQLMCSDWGELHSDHARILANTRKRIMQKKAEIGMYQGVLA